MKENICPRNQYITCKQDKCPYFIGVRTKEALSFNFEVCNIFMVSIIGSQRQVNV